MSTNTQSAHYEYTINEWSSIPHKKCLDIIFKDNNINVIYDIGANVGGTTKIFLDYCKNNNKNINKIYCFEPDLENITYLQNKLDDYINNQTVIPIHKGVYYGKKKANVFGAGHISEKKIHENVGGYSIEECMKEFINIRNKRGENVFCEQINNKVFYLDTLENLSSSFLLPDFIKIDVEGAEKNILSNSTIIKNAKYILIEWNQEESIDEIIKKVLPQYEIISYSADILLKKKCY